MSIAMGMWKKLPSMDLELPRLKTSQFEISCGLFQCPRIRRQGDNSNIVRRLPPASVKLVSSG